MRVKWRIITSLIIACLIAAGLLISEGGLHLTPNKPAVTPKPVAAVQGNFGKYLYGVTDVAQQSKKRVQFEPSLPPDDTLVVNVLKAVAHDGYGLVLDAVIPPAVETINETNYITFTVGREKVYFELFRNTSGEVGAANFWQQQLP